jgi:hypothetical protein
MNRQRREQKNHSGVKQTKMMPLFLSALGNVFHFPKIAGMVKTWWF